MKAAVKGQNIILTEKKQVILTPLVMTTLFSLTFFMYEDFKIRMLYGYLILAAFAVWYYAGHSETISFHNGKKMAFFLAVILTLMVLWPTARLEQGVIYLILAVDMGMLMVIISDPKEEDLRAAMTLFKTGAVLASLYLIAVFFFPNIYYNGTRNLINPKSANTVDLLLRDGYGVAIGGNVVIVDYIAFIGFAISLNTLLSGAGKKKERWKDLAVAAVCFLAILLMNRKSELLVTILVTLFLFTQRISFTSTAGRKKAVRALLGAVVLLGAAIIIMASRGHLTRYVAFLQKMLSNAVDDTSFDVSSGRTKFWKLAWGLFQDAPVLGIGWGQFANHVTGSFNIYADQAMKNVHNNYLQLLCETGVVGTVLVLTPIFLLLGRTFRQAIRNRRDGKTATVQGIGVLTSLSFQLYAILLSVIDPIWYKMVYWGLFAALLILGNG